MVISKIYLKNDKMYFDCRVLIESKSCIYFCFEKTYFHDYRFSEIKDIPVSNEEVTIRTKIQLKYEYFIAVM